MSVWKKDTIYWKFWDYFRKFWKDFLRKWQKCIILAYFSKYLTNHALIFPARGRKTQIVGKFWENFEDFWWKFYRIIELFIYFLFSGKFVTKIEPSEITPFFYSNFFGFGGIPHFPLATPLPSWNGIPHEIFKPLICIFLKMKTNMNHKILIVTI